MSGFPQRLAVPLASLLAALPLGCDTTAHTTAADSDTKVAKSHRLSPPEGDVSIEFSGVYVPLNTAQTARIQASVLSLDPTAKPTIYGLRQDGGPAMAAVLTMTSQLTAEGEQPASLISQCEGLALEALDSGELSLAVTPNPEQRFVDIVGTTASVEGWARYRLWVDGDANIQTRACVCTFAACGEVQSSCKLPTPEGALPIDAKPAPTPEAEEPTQHVAELQISHGPHQVTAKLPEKFEAVDTSTLEAIVAQERSAYPALQSLHIQGAFDPDDRSNAFVQIGSWCAATETDCTVNQVSQTIEDSARVHGERDGRAVSVSHGRANVSQSSARTLEIRLGDHSWERRALWKDNNGVHELACLCIGRACPEVETSCSFSGGATATR